MKIKKKQLCQLTGISPATLRYYVDEKIVTPEQDRSNGYYYYSYEDAMVLLRVRELRSLGFSMEEAAAILRRQREHEDTVALFHRKRAELLEEKQALEEKLRVLNNHIYDRIIQPVGAFLYHAPTPTYAAFFNGHQNSIEAVHELHRFLPSSQPTLQLVPGTSGFQPGLTIECAVYENLKALGPGITLEHLSQKRILLHKTLPDLSIISAEDFAPVFEYAHKHNFIITSNVFCIVRHVFIENDKTGCIVVGGVCYQDE